MPRTIRKEIEMKYGFPNFTKRNNNLYLCDSNKLILSDIWAFWDYAIKKNRTTVSFMKSLLEQAKYFFYAAEQSPINSKPLLYYYSFLNFAKMLINIENSYGQARTYMHGIKEVSGTKFRDSKIEISQLKTFIVNVSAELYKVLDGVALTSLLQLNVRELLRSCVGVHRTYCEIYGIKEVFANYRIFHCKRTAGTLNFVRVSNVHPIKQHF